MQKRIYLGNGARYSHFDEIFDTQGIHRVTCNILPKSFSHHFLAAILNLCIKCKKLIILIMVQDRAISAISKSFTYFWVIYHTVKLQIYSSLHSLVIATEMSKCLLSLKVLLIRYFFKISHSPTFG